MHNNVKAKIKGHNTEIYENIGIKQGDAISPRLFNIYINELPTAIHDSEDQNNIIVLWNRLIKCLLYADDLALFSTTAEGINKQLQKLHEFCKELELTVSIEKTETMYIHQNNKEDIDTKLPSIKYQDKTLNYVKHFKYVGITLTHDGTFDAHINKAIDKAITATRILKSKIYRLGINSPLQMKITLFKAYVQPILMYGMELINPTKDQYKKLNKVTEDYTRWILGSSPKSQTLATLTLGDFKLIEFDIHKQQVNYLYTLLHRHKENITSIALRQIIENHEHPMNKN